MVLRGAGRACYRLPVCACDIYSRDYCGGLSSAARNGVLIKGGAYLEAPARLKAIAFDKTGTITFGEPAVKQVMPVGNHSEDGLLANAAAIEAHSTHPVARAIMRHAESRGIRAGIAESFTILPGQGAEGLIGGKTYWIGSHRMLERWQRESPVFHDAISKTGGGRQLANGDVVRRSRLRTGKRCRLGAP